MSSSTMHQGLLVALLLCPLINAQTASTPAAKTQQLDEESTKVLSSLQAQTNDLSPIAKQNVVNAIDALTIEKPIASKLRPEISNPEDLLNLNPQDLTLNEKMRTISVLIDANRLQIQQVVDPTIPAEPAAASAINALANTLNKLSKPGTKVVSSEGLAPIFTKAQSIGRILWTFQDLLNKGDPMWQLAGTGFVSSPGVVTTACHVVSLIADVSGGQAKIRAGLVVRMDFSDSATFQKLIPIINVVAISKTTGCDIAQLALEGGSDIVPLKMTPATAATKRVLVVGYPLLDNYTLDDCSAAGSSVTEVQFCGFRKSNPQTVKVISPGTVLTCCNNDHGGVSVLTYNASTDGGQSGSPVFDADTLEVVGVHYCCTGDQPSTGLMDCDTWHPQNIKWNEAITTQSLLDDSSLKDHFSDVGPGTPAVAAIVQPRGLPRRPLVPPLIAPITLEESLR